MQGDGRAMRAAAEVEPAREAAAQGTRCARPRRDPRAPGTPAVSPLAPAAQGCARTVVPAIICTSPASPSPSARVSSITSRSPEAARRGNRRNAGFRRPGSAGRSHHHAPRRAIRKIAGGTGRRSHAGPPPSDRTGTTKGSTNAHSSSVGSARIKADLLPGDQPRITRPRIEAVPLRRLVRADRQSVSSSLAMRSMTAPVRGRATGMISRASS